MPEHLKKVPRTHSKRNSTRKSKAKKMGNEQEGNLIEFEPDPPKSKDENQSRAGQENSEERVLEESTGQFAIVDHEIPRDVDQPASGEKVPRKVDQPMSSEKVPRKVDQPTSSEKVPRKVDQPTSSEKVPVVPSEVPQVMPTGGSGDAGKTIIPVMTQETETTDFETQLELLRSENQKTLEKLVEAKFSRLHSEVQQQVSTPKNEERVKDIPVGTRERREYEEKIRALSKAAGKMDEQINILLDAQEQALKYQTEIESRYRGAVAHIEKQHREREESELNLRTEINEVRGQCQREKERAQKLMKTMAEMQSADPFKLDNNVITATVKELRYNIKNWAWGQRLVPSLPAPGVISAYVNRAVGGQKEKGPNYEFLGAVTPHWAEYTERTSDFRWLLQAYLWKRLVELIFYDDLWAGIRRPLDDEETEYKLLGGYRAMKSRLEPDEDSSEAHTSQFHSWRSATARIITTRISASRRQNTLSLIRNEIISPLISATQGLPPESAQQIQHVEDLDAIIEATMRLGSQLAQQRAHFVFEPVPIGAYGKAEFNKNMWTDPYANQYGAEQYDPRTHVRVVLLTLSPRLLKFGTSEGTELDSCMQLLEGEVETGIIPRRGRWANKNGNSLGVVDR